ncbi:MAG: pirin family protein [Nanoarchaeota archaeon]|nr:pirin family protein [Nanoarchaeota archaeon]
MEDKNYTIFKSEQRGHFKFSILETRHSFSFGNWYEPSRMGFGALKVLNDDIFEPGQGFGMHPHDNMEIITIPLEGIVKHEDSTGGNGLIKPGQIQVMSAGSGVLHSEVNGDETTQLKLFQIWIEPNAVDVEPRYDEAQIDYEHINNSSKLLISPDSRENSLMIHQNAFISMMQIDKEDSLTYNKFDSNNGVFVLLVEGEVEVSSNEFENILIEKRDSLECQNSIDTLSFNAKENSKLLIIEVPMNY